MSRKHLPYRETSDAFLIYEGKILALDKGHYCQYPGGGVDPGETPDQAVKREIMEEVGCKVEKLKLISTIESDWWEGWTEGREKRIKRYKEFRGERTHLFIGYITEFKNPTSKEGDAWQVPVKNHLIDPKKLIAKLEKILPSNHENFKCYTTNQLAIVKMIQYFKETLRKK